MIRWIAATLFLFAFTVSISAAQSTPLNEATIRAFIASIADLEAWSDANKEKVEDVGDLWDSEPMEGDVSNPFAAAAKMIEAQSWADEVVKIIEGHGFDGLQDWGRKGSRIFMAVMAVQVETSKPEMDAGLAEALKQIEASGMNEDQKAAMREALGTATQMSELYKDVPEQDKKAVTPFIDELQNMGADRADQ